MTHRIGECSSCGATYKLPASFAADRARCKNCGGVVEIGSTGGAKPSPAAASPPVPAAQPRAAKAPAEPKQESAAKPKREGPSMKERLIAARQAEAEKAAAKPASKPAAARSAAKPVARPAAKATAKPAAAKAGARGSRTSTPARSRRGSSRRGGGDDDAEEGGGRRRGRPEKKKPSMLPALLGLVALIAVGGGAAWYVMNSDSTDETPDEVAAADNNASEETPANGAGEALDAAVDEGADAPADESTTEAAGTPDEGGDAAAPEATEQAAKPVKKADPKDPASVDLDAIADFGPMDGVSDDRFAELNQLVATMVDPMAGAAGNRAKTKLEEAGKESFPSILNAMKRLDLTDEDQFRSADVCQKALQNICNGNNFGWKYPSQEPEGFHYFDKRVIESWCKQWERVKDDDAAWAKLAKLDKVEASPAEDAAAQDDLDDALDALDDI